MRPTFFPLFVLLAMVALCLPPQSRALPLRGPGQSAFGISSYMASRHPDPSNMATPTTLLAQVEAGWVREDFQFHRIMPRRGQFDWTFHDQVIDQLAACRITIIGLLNGPTPGWAVGRQGNDFYTPNPQAFAAFAPWSLATRTGCAIGRSGTSRITASTGISLWVYGDGSGHALRVWLRDAQGETLQFRLGFVPTASLRSLRALR